MKLSIQQVRDQLVCIATSEEGGTVVAEMPEIMLHLRTARTSGRGPRKNGPRQVSVREDDTVGIRRPREFQVGDRVQVKVIKPWGGWGDVRSHWVGTVHRIGPLGTAISRYTQDPLMRRPDFIYVRWDNDPDNLNWKTLPEHLEHYTYDPED